MKNNFKLFISHSSDDRKLMEFLVNLFASLGISQKSIICTSLNEYGIPLGNNIYDWLRDQFQSYHLHIFYALSANYYKSVVCLNEMGAAWVSKTNDTIILLPGFEKEQIQGCIDKEKIFIDLNADHTEIKCRLLELKNQLMEEFEIQESDSLKWDNELEKFMLHIGKCPEFLSKDSIELGKQWVSKWVIENGTLKL